MGRELKKVTAEFDWPLQKVWEGYVNPHYRHCHNCTTCEGSGFNPATKVLSNEWYGKNDYDWVPYSYKRADGTIHRRQHNRSAWSHDLTQHEVDALIKGNRLIDFTHDWTGKEWVKKDPPVIPTAEEVNEWSKQGLGHDGINQHICVKARAEKLGIYGDCPICKGKGEIWDTPEDEKAAAAWKRTEPPVGSCFQIWETVSEGSPISPPLEKPEDLATWMFTKYPEDGTYEQWVKFIKGPGWAPSGVISGGRWMSGVEAMSVEAI
jgi:hypothetical protein